MLRRRYPDHVAAVVCPASSEAVSLIVAIFVSRGQFEFVVLYSITRPKCQDLLLSAGCETSHASTVSTAIKTNSPDGRNVFIPTSYLLK